MADYLYRARIAHTEKTVEQLYKMQYYAYEKPRMILWAVIGFGLVAAAVISGLPTWGKALMILFGAWLLVPGWYSYRTMGYSASEPVRYSHI